MKSSWLEEAVAHHPGIENAYLKHLEERETDLDKGLRLARIWGEQEMPVSLALCTRWLPIVLGRIWSSAFFERHSPTRVPLNFVELMEQSHGLVHNMAEEFGEEDVQKAHPMLLYKLLRELGTHPETWTATRETDDLVRAGTRVCETGTLAECMGFMWGAEKFAELEFTRILKGLKRLGAPERMLIYWRVNVGADQEHSEALGRLVNEHVSNLTSSERAPVIAAARLFFDRKADFFAAISRMAGIPT